jgi:anti-sigma factor RsiW
MDCTQVEDLLVAQLDAPDTPAEESELRHHLEGCDRCRAFAALQRQIDAELADGAPVLLLDARFRRAVEARVAVQRLWPEWLPDLAYVVGGAFATAATILALPFPVSGTWWIGGALAGLGLVAHSLIGQAICAMDVPDGC